MDAYLVMHEWDNAAGNQARTDAYLDREVAALFPPGEYETWKKQIEEGNVAAIKRGMQLWGLPIGPLKPFEVDDALETHERDYEPGH
jgi:hypothetical protein